MSLAVAVVHFGETQRTARLIQKLASIDALTVVLHSPYTVQRAPSVTWIEQENRGFAAGLNLAAKRFLSETDIDTVAALNPDVVADDRSLKALYKKHLDTGSACTFPVLREKNMLIPGYRFSRLGSLQIVNEPDWYSGACFLFSLNAWKQIGGFDESFFHYFEDWDYCMRLRKAGFKIHQVPEIVIEHEGKSGADFPACELAEFAVRNHLIALQRSGRLGPIVFLNVIFRHFAYLFRWQKGWRGIPRWSRGIAEFVRSK